MNAELDFTWIRGVRDAMLGSDLVEPPAWVRERARQILQPTRASLVERVRATLVFDSRSNLARLGVRAAAGVVEGPWQLLYRGGDVDIDLLVRPNQDGHTASVRGQALSLSGSLDAGVAVVEAVAADAPRVLQDSPAPYASSNLEPTGEFALPNLERGRYVVLLRFGAREIELSGVEL
jgi:hypothetical protein